MKLIRRSTKFDKSPVRPRVAVRLESCGPASIPTLVREGLMTSRQLGHKVLCSPWFRKLPDDRVDLTAAGKKALRSLRRTLGSTHA
jgi:hypothetical protein